MGEDEQAPDLDCAQGHFQLGLIKRYALNTDGGEIPSKIGLANVRKKLTPGLVNLNWGTCPFTY